MKIEVLKDKFCKIFGGLQKLGPAMIPAIAIMPIAGLMQSIGIILTLPQVVDFLPFLSSTFFATFATILLKIGQLVMSNFHILFCISVVAAYTKNDAIAALAAVLSFLTTNLAIGTILNITDEMVAKEWMMYTNVLGINTLSMGVFGGIIVGLMVAWLYSKFKNIKLPMAISFFEGKRFIPIVSVFGSIVLAVILSILWPIIQGGLNSLNDIMNSSMSNTVLFMVIGIFITQLLIPLGIHTIVWASMAYQFGTWVNSSGEVFHGLFPIHFAQIADGAELTVYPFISGGYINIALLLAVGTAIIITAKPENKLSTKAEIIPGMITGLVCGITEPLTFTFLFSAFPLYFIHAVLWAIIGETVPFLIKFTVSTGAWGGLVDFIVYGPLQGDSSWWIAIPVDIIIFLLATVFYVFVIRKLDLKTPGRELVTVDENVSLTDVIKETETINNTNKNDLDKPKAILEALGGKENLIELDACLTRLRVSLRDMEKLNEMALRKLGASGVLKVGKEVQVVFGTQAVIIKSMIESILDNKVSNIKPNEIPQCNPGIIEDIVSPANGKIIPLTEVRDIVFSQGMAGCGFGLIPTNGKVFSPVNGRVLSIFPTKHAIVIISDLGKEVLVHMGIDTSKMKGKPFTIEVCEGDLVTTGSIIANMDIGEIALDNKDTTISVLFTNIPTVDVEIVKLGNVFGGEENIIKFVNKYIPI